MDHFVIHLSRKIFVGREAARNAQRLEINRFFRYHRELQLEKLDAETRKRAMKSVQIDANFQRLLKKGRSVCHCCECLNEWYDWQKTKLK